ncbi:hypothetical protein FAF44_03175 [Nonomuraea sp. MG754425]|uniref:hypothetical protein n=1 Tax=Nonomuraea sp. MG754425 TaxID=2570319 RepID=UPI001F269B68|nr:hypothetical protein [Nonomuraea sp. MG754425]MCF6467417.1 hypothetical protein [Nonomuraea sp. MG754425]
MALLTRPRTHYEKIGEGNHSEVYHRPGSRWCVQLFKMDCPELTAAKVRREHAYLMEAYADMPGLIPSQRLFAPDEDAHISRTLLIKEWVQVDASLPLNRIHGDDLTPGRRAQLQQFIGITRDLLARGGTEEVFLPDLNDPQFTNLGFDVAGALRLLDTNRLISTAKLMSLPKGEALDLVKRRIHAKWLRRLMYLEAAFAGRSRSDLRSDPLFTRYLSPASFDALFNDSIAVGELL